jgi:hypothetical protein
VRLALERVAALRTAASERWCVEAVAEHEIGGISAHLDRPDVRLGTDDAWMTGAALVRVEAEPVVAGVERGAARP